MKTPLIKLRYFSRRHGYDVYAKLEMHNLTGTHKDRVMQEFVKDAKLKGMRKIGITSTGNAGISLAFYCNLHGLDAYIFVDKSITPEKIKYLKAFNAKLMFGESYKQNIQASNRFFECNDIYNCNPSYNDLSYSAYKNIAIEIREEIDPDYLIMPVNNGSLLLGLVKTMGKGTKFIGTISKKSNLCGSINGFNFLEREKLANFSDRIQYLNISDKMVKTKASELILNEGLFPEFSSVTTLCALKKLKLDGNVCIILTGAGIKYPEVHNEITKRN